jgi:hypothetical protein
MDTGIVAHHTDAMFEDEVLSRGVHVRVGSYADPSHVTLRAAWVGTAHARHQYGRPVFEYVSREPGGETGRFVESIWFARGHITGVRERIAPTGSTVAAVVLGDPIRQTPDGAPEALLAQTGFLIGPHDRPIVNEPVGKTYCIGIVTTPVGCRPALGLAPATLRGRVVDLRSAWPRADDLRRALLACETP